MKDLISLLNSKKEALRLGGGLDKIKKHKAKGKLTAWERIQYLIDKDSYQKNRQRQEYVYGDVK